MKVDEVDSMAKQMLVYEIEWEVGKMDEIGWNWMKVDESGRKWKKVDESG